MKHFKTITIDQLKPGMFIVGMDQPWYRTPFLLHKRLIRDTKDIALLRQHGIRELNIDPSQGLDVEPNPAGDRPTASHKRETAAAQSSPAQNSVTSDKTAQPAYGAERNPAQPKSLGTQNDTPTVDTRTIAYAHLSNLAVNSPSPEQTTQLVSSAISAQLQPPGAREGAPTPSKAREQAEAAQATYTEAISSMEHTFEELEAGIVPQPERLRTVVTNVLSRVLENSTSMLSLLSFQKMKRFDRTLASHALDVCTLSLIVAHDYGVAEEDMEALGAGALLHDIGYVRLPRNLYRRSHDLTEQERTLMQHHPALGLAMLRDAQEDRDAVIRIVAEHHECVDGSGFPHKLREDSLSILAQLVALADVYDGMVSRHGGRPGMLPHDAIKQLFRLGDTGQCQKDLIHAMIGSLGVYPIGSLVLMNTGEQAVVVEMNPAKRLKPIVNMIAGPRGESYLPPIRVDLGAPTADASARTIAKVLDPLHERVNVAMFLDATHEEAA